MRKIISILLGAALALGLFVLAAPTSSATLVPTEDRVATELAPETVEGDVDIAPRALSGCKSLHRFQVSGRAQNEYFHEPMNVSKVPYRVSVKNVYIYCPNGRSSWKAQPRTFEACWTQYGDETNHAIFDGVTFYPRVGGRESGLRGGPWEFKVGDDGTRQNCGRFAIPLSELDWIWGFDGPRWALSFKLHLVGAQDHNHYFGEGATGGSDWKAYQILNDDILTGWIR